MHLFYKIKHVKHFLIYKTLCAIYLALSHGTGRIADFEFLGGGARGGGGGLPRYGERSADAGGDLKADRAAAFAQRERKIFWKRREDFGAA